MPYRSYFLTPEGSVESELSEAAIQDALRGGDGSLWLDFDGPTAEDAELLRRVFGLHPLSVDSCLDLPALVPKVDDYDDHIFIVARGIDYTVDTRILSTTEMGIFLGRNFVISVHSGLMYNIESVIALVERDGLPLRRGSTFLAYMLLDALVLNLVPGINGLEEWVDDIEDSVIERPDPSALEAILDLKRSSFQLRRAIAPQRDMLNRLSRAEFAHVTGDALPYYRDIYETILRIESQNETLRDRADTTLSVYLSLVANQQNDLMRVLAVVATVFMPLGPDRRNLRHELRVHPRAGLPVGILRRPRSNGHRHRRRPVGLLGQEMDLHRQKAAGTVQTHHHRPRTPARLRKQARPKTNRAPHHRPQTPRPSPHRPQHYRPQKTRPKTTKVGLASDSR